MLFLKALLRQSKVRLLFLVNLFKRMLCFFTNRRKSSASSTDMIGSDNFIVVQTGDISNSFRNFNNSTNKLNIDNGGGIISNIDFPIDSHYNPQVLDNNQNLSSFNRDNLNYSAHSLTVTAQHKNPPGPTRQQQNTVPEPEPEPDYFQDMIPRFKKPKTIYVSQDVDPNSSDVVNKFRVSNQMNVNLDGKQFTQFGTLDESKPLEAENESTWEDMAAEEGSWDNIDQSLQEIRLEKRERRLREHEQQRMMKAKQSQ